MWLHEFSGVNQQITWLHLMEYIVRIGFIQMGQRDIPRQIYLSQIPIVNNKREEATTASSYHKIYVQQPIIEGILS